jgi:hypothetical protein
MELGNGKRSFEESVEQELVGEMRTRLNTSGSLAHN